MKIFSLVLVATLLAGAVYGSNIDYLTNRSVSYIRNFARNAATEGADLVTYNPAGLVFLDEGFHLSFGNQFLLKDYTIEAEPFWLPTETETYESTKPTLLLPDLYTVYRTDQWAIFGSFTIPAGGGSLDYKDGIYAMSLIETGLQQALHPGPYSQYYFAVQSDGYIKASSMYMAGTLGASYAFSDLLSMGLAGRYVSGERTYDGQGDFTIFGPDSGGSVVPIGTSSRILDVEKSASGIGGIISLDVMPTPDLNVALRYETATSLDWETTVNENSWGVYGLPDSSFTDGYKQRRDLPAVIAGGVSYRFSPQFQLSTMFNYFMLEDADQGENDGINDNYGNGLDIGIGFDYHISPSVLASLGYLRSDLGGDKGTYTDLEYNLDYHALGGGVRYAVNDDFALNFAIGHNFYDEGQGEGVYEACTYNKSVTYFGLGAELSFR
jgi:long-chain fatty acid transport protein